MKNLVLALVFTLFFAGVSNASTGPTKENTVNVARALYNTLQLNELQYIKIKNLDKVRMQEQQDAQANLKDEALLNELTAINSRFDAAVKTLLTSAQLEAFQAYKNK